MRNTSSDYFLLPSTAEKRTKTEIYGHFLLDRIERAAVAHWHSANAIKKMNTELDHSVLLYPNTL